MLHVSVLGEQAIADDLSGPRMGSARAMTLLAYLVIHAESRQARQRIAGLLWPESTDAQALTNLRRELHQLRQVLPDEPSLVVTPADLCWRDTQTCRVDLRVFETERQAALAAAAADNGDDVIDHADRAIAQYRGDLLPGVYDDWALEARMHLERDCADLCDLLCRARTKKGDLAEAAQAARRRIQLQPLEEAGYRALMQLQVDMGDRAAAVTSYHHCASVLERELGIVPDPATRLVFQRLLADARPGGVGPAGIGGPASVEGAGPAGVEHALPRSGPATVQLVGRSAEISLLQRLWREAATGRPGLALVCGAAGVGKTRLAAELAQLARTQGAVVAGSQCFGRSGRLALAPVADWLRSPAVAAVTARLDERWRAEVERLVPPGRRAERAAVPAVMADAWQGHRFFEGLARALHAVGRPMLLLLENLQWCDQETLAFLTFCLGLAPTAKLLVVATLRNDNSVEDHALVDWIDRMRATGLLTEIALSPLEAADTACLGDAISGRQLSAADRDLLQATTGGFPLYVVEAVRGITASGPVPIPAGDLAAVLRNRLDQMTSPARQVAGLAAATGGDFTLDLLTEASDLDADVVVAAVDELWQRRILREFRDGYDFSHDLLRETAYAQVSPPKRWLLHRRIAQSLELLHADDADLVAAPLAEQYARGGRPAQAVAYYQRAAGVAAGMFAYDEAIRLHKDALSIVRGLPAGSGRDGRELEVLQAMAAPLNARYGYSSPELQQTLERSIALAESLRRPDSTLTGLVALWTSRFVQGRTADAYQTASRALDLAEPGSTLGGLAHFAVGGSALSLGRPAEAVRHLELAASLTTGAVSLIVGTRPEIHSMAWAAHAHWLLGHDQDAQLSSDGAIKLARAIDHPYNLAVALAYCGITRQMRGDMASLRDAVAELRELCDRHGFAYYREWALILDGWSRRDESGIAIARRGIDNLKAAGSFARMPYWLSLLADLSARGCQPGAARATLDAAVVAARTRDDLWWLPEVLRQRAAFDQGRAAISRLQTAAQLASAHGSTALLRRCERDLADLATSSPDRRTRTPARERSANGTGPSVAVFASPSYESEGQHDYDSS
jgi:DNA-binding SARP family transcriptional activator